MGEKCESENRYLERIPIEEFIEKLVYRIDLDADYQREKIWTPKEKRDLLDSIIRDIDIPKLYLVEVKDNDQFDFECVDGKQRITTLINFFKPELDEFDEKPVKIEIKSKMYTYNKLKEDFPKFARDIEEFCLDITIFKNLSEDLIRDIFRRLQLGERLNSGEMLKSRTGTIRDFVFNEIGKFGPFFSNTSLSEKRFSREFTLSQICMISFKKKKLGEFKRARLLDLEDFFEDNHDLPENDDNLERIRNVLNSMNSFFGEKADIISSRAVAVSAYLFCEQLVNNKQEEVISKFVDFYENLLKLIKENNKQLNMYKPPPNPLIMEKFHKYISQASVEPYSIKNRHNFLQIALKYYLENNEKIIDDYDEYEKIRKEIIK